MDKVVRDGKVAVLVSHGFGAGWSTWADDDQREAMLFHPRLVEAAEKEMSVGDVDLILADLFGADNAPDTGGWRKIRIQWLPVGERFFVNEYRGSEDIVTSDDLIIVA